jgi:hypothetical protein
VLVDFSSKQRDGIRAQEVHTASLGLCAMTFERHSQTLLVGGDSEQLIFL